MSLRKRERERAERAALERIRGRIVSGIHSSHLDTGDRLPSYREVSEETGLDLRAVGRVYSILEDDGLVEVRGKTGVYVASQERIGGRVLAETARWTVAVLTDALQRRIRLQEYPSFVQRCISSVSLRCACVESTEDQLVSLCGEVSDDYGCEAAPIHADAILGLTSDTAAAEAPQELLDADIIISTAFHAATIHALGAALKKPVVIMKLDPDLTHGIERLLAEGEVPVVCADPRFIDRIRMVFEYAHGERIRGISVTNRQALARLASAGPALVTRAARNKLTPDLALKSALPGNVRVFSPQSAAELIEAIIRLNLEAMRRGNRAASTRPRRTPAKPPQ